MPHDRAAIEQLKNNELSKKDHGFISCHGPDCSRGFGSSSKAGQTRRELEMKRNPKAG
jgi:hypothetical protein